MNFFPAHPVERSIRKCLFSIFLLSLILYKLCLPQLTFGVDPTNTPTPTPTAVPTPAAVAPPVSTVNWTFDQEVTNVGKAADRARQFLWWVFNKPPVHTVPVLLEIWAFSRNIVYVFIILVIVAFGVGLILSQKRGPLGPVFSGISSPLSGITNPVSIIIKVVIILLYVTFSYAIVLALIQISEIVMQFFIHNVGGKDLFNVVFSGSGNIEENYTAFVGYRDANPYNAESAKTALFIINFTSFTYYIMGIIIILRNIILWLLLAISPFLALLMPFVFIRNIGWIWIGVFFQWLFYGPLMAMFLSALTRIWVAGIPYPFDFSRRDTSGGQIYRTAINILYGGPAQILSPTNSANYVDTFAEYVISLIMLWATILLPWLLLRIFRDYCCDVIAKGNATLSSMFDRMRQYPVPPPPTPSAPSPTTTVGMAVELPFREKIEEKVYEVERTKIENIREVSNVSTVDIAKSMDMAVSSLSDISRMEMNDIDRSAIERNFEKIASASSLASPAEREFYTRIKNELQNRASSGDQVAATILAASSGRKDILAEKVQVISAGRPIVAVPSISITGVLMPAIIPTQQLADILRQTNVITNIANQVNISDDQVKKVLQTICNMNIVNMTAIKETAKESGVPERAVQEIVVAAQMAINLGPAPLVSAATILSQPESIKEISQKTQVSSEKVKEVIQALPTLDISDLKVLSEVVKTTQVSQEKVQEIVAAAQMTVNLRPAPLISATAILSQPESIREISLKAQVSEEKVKEVIQALPTLDISDPKVLSEMVKTTQVSEEKVKEIVSTASQMVTGLVETPFAGQRPGAGKVAKSVSVGGKVVPTQVSVEDYEDVKKMWLKHYRGAPIPVSENIKNRRDWLGEEEHKLTNISHLLSSPDQKLRHEGFEKVSGILPFMLLGGFTDLEVLTYVKAKLEAAKQIGGELEVAEKAKEEVKSQLQEEEETLLEVPGEKKEEKKEMAAQEEKKMRIPEKPENPKS